MKKGERGSRKARRIALLATGALIAVGAVAVVLIGRSSAGVPTAVPELTPPPSLSADELTRAVDAVGFRPTPGPKGQSVEDLPADASLPLASPGLLPVGSPAPDFALSTPDGRRFRLSELRGKTVLLEFSATWCDYCQTQTPHLVRLYGDLASSDVVFLAVNGDSEDATSVAAYERFYRVPYSSLLDPGGPPGSFKQPGGPGLVTQAYKIARFPTFYVLTRSAGRNQTG